MVDVQRVKYYFTVDTVRAGTGTLASISDVLAASPALERHALPTNTCVPTPEKMFMHKR